jgi:hypothetical protein
VYQLIELRTDSASSAKAELAEASAMHKKVNKINELNINRYASTAALRVMMPHFSCGPRSRQMSKSACLEFYHENLP